MKLWLLTALETDYDCKAGFVIRARTEESARKIANENGSDEVRSNPEFWLTPKTATAEEITSKGNEEIILTDFRAG